MIRRFAKSTTLTIIFLAILLYAALSPMPAQAMKRESITPDLIIQPADLYTALDWSLAVGDGRKVDFSQFGMGW